METLEKIIKKSKNFLGAGLLGFATFYSCQNPANPEISKPKSEITKPENYSPEKPAKKIVTLSLEEPIKTYAFGNNGIQRHNTPFGNYTYPDQLENVQINVEGNLTKQEKKNLFNKLEGQYYLAVHKQTGKDTDTEQTIKVNIAKDGEKLFLRLPVNRTNNLSLTVEQAIDKRYNLNEKIIPNGIYDLKGGENLLKKLQKEGVSFASEKFGVLDKDQICKGHNAYKASDGGCTR